MGARPALARAMTSAISRTGARTPVLECTQVTATTRVRGVSAWAIAPAMADCVADEGSS